MAHNRPVQPQIGVGAVVLYQDRVLLIKRGKPPRQGQWSLPGGRQELGETVEDAMRRELMEETGIENAQPRFLTIVDLIDRGDDGSIHHHYTLIDWLIEVDDPTVRAGSDAADAQWFERSEIHTMPLWSETKRIIEMAYNACEDR